MSEPVNAAQTLNCLGLYCPIPLLRTREVLDRIGPGEILEVITDDPAAEEDLKRFAKRAGHEVVAFERGDDHMRFLIRRKV